MTIHRTITAALLVAALSTPAMAAGAMAPMQMAAAESPNTIVMKNFDFTPKAMTVTAGTTVTWRNMDEEPHTVVSTDGLFRSSALDTKETFAFKFTKPGIYKYICSIHPKMVGTITVK
jgi:plastocyanin